MESVSNEDNIKNICNDFTYSVQLFGKGDYRHYTPDNTFPSAHYGYPECRCLLLWAADWADNDRQH